MAIYTWPCKEPPCRFWNNVWPCMTYLNPWYPRESLGNLWISMGVNGYHGRPIEIYSCCCFLRTWDLSQPTQPSPPHRPRACRGRPRRAWSCSRGSWFFSNIQHVQNIVDILGTLWKSMKITGNLWKFMKSIGIHWISWPWKAMDIHRYPWKSMENTCVGVPWAFRGVDRGRPNTQKNGLARTKWHLQKMHEIIIIDSIKFSREGVYSHGHIYTYIYIYI